MDKKGTRNVKRCVSCQEKMYVACKKCPKCKAQQPHKDRLVKDRKKFAAEEKEWKERVKKNCNATHVLDSSFKMLDRLAALGYFPLLLLGKKRRNGYTADVLTSMQMKLDDCLEEDLKEVYGKVLKLHFRRFLQPHPETSEDCRTEQEAEYVVLDLFPVPVDDADLVEETTTQTKKLVFDKEMLLSRLREEDGILIKEMSNHCRYLKGSLKSMKREIQQIEEDLDKQSCPFNMSLEAYEGLKDLLKNKLQEMETQMKEAFSIYRNVLMDPTALQEEEEEEGEDEMWDGDPLTLDADSSDDEIDEPLPDMPLSS